MNRMIIFYSYYEQNEHSSLIGDKNGYVWKMGKNPKVFRGK